MKMDKMLVYVIADYGDLHDLAFAEVTQKLYSEMKGVPANIATFSVPAFDTYATGFALAQTALNSELGPNHKFFVNTAPRKDDLMPRVSNSGEGFVYVRLTNGVEICAVNSGYSLAFVKESAEEIRKINCSVDGSQFRSRDVFPAAFGKIVNGDYSELGEDVMDHVPDAPTDTLCYTDGYGNMKCALDIDDIMTRKGQDIIVEANGQQQIVRVADGIFGVEDGQFCLSVGSSGWTSASGETVKFAEIVKRGGSAASVFDLPNGGAPITWRAIH
tara:strand:+ start:136931 stop:137749 length:819 start_codon:yes stop_codon:yes gene_type:complete